MAPSTSECRGALICIHHAGGGAASFRNWPRFLGPSVQVGAIALPGREGLFAQAPFTDFALAVDRIARDIDRAIDRPYALFGHSLGAMLAFETACRLERSGRRPPSCLIVSGRRALHLPGVDAEEDDRPSSTLPDSEFEDLLRRMGGTPPQILASPEMMRMFLPVVRADFGLVENYRWDGESRASCPILAIGGEADRHATRDGLLQWSALTTATATARTFRGGHFFVATDEAEVCAVIAEFLGHRF